MKCNHPDPIPGLDAHFCPVCRSWFREAWQLEAAIATPKQTGKRGRKKEEPTD